MCVFYSQGVREKPNVSEKPTYTFIVKCIEYLYSYSVKQNHRQQFWNIFVLSP